MYCESYEEKECLKKLEAAYPNQLYAILDLMAWVFINKPERFDEIISEYKNKEDHTMINLEDVDYKKLLKHAS